MTVQFIHDGDAIDYTPSADVAAGDVVVQEDLIGVAKLDIPADTLGALHVTGVFDFPKAVGSGTAITAGLEVNWDAVNKEAYPRLGGSSSDKLLGKSVAAAGDNDATVRVRLVQ
jgi:predicted RecA/RadA family phage recombinase